MISASIVAVQISIAKTVSGIVMIARKSGDMGILDLLFGTEKDNYPSGNTADFTQDKVIIYKGELEYISRCILDYPNIETGGNLFGFYTATHIPFIQYVLGPGVNSEHHNIRFTQDYAFFNLNADLLIKEHALHHIGVWHSHHKLGIDQPSSGDAASMFNGMKTDRVDNFLLIIGNIVKKTNAKAYNFSLPNKSYQYCQWVVLDGESPIRLQFDKKHKNVIHEPKTNEPIMELIQSVPLYGEAQKSLTYPEGYWLNDKSNNAELKVIVDTIKNKYSNVSFYIQEEDKTLGISIKDADKYDIAFPLKFPNVPPVIQHNNKILKDFGWGKQSPISTRFLKYCIKGSIL